MRISINGEHQEMTDGLTGAQLLRLLNIAPTTAVAEYNGRIMQSAAFQIQELQDGDVIELVTLVGGG